MCRVYDLELRVHGAGYMEQCARCRGSILDVGFGIRVWGVGLGVQGLETRVYLNSTHRS